ncbi:MAG: hypothetical protein M3081_17380 [Gemmatimonadota bacterium]|nr:hypothetical protein [Gemmatimonadota bacterium]
MRQGARRLGAIAGALLVTIGMSSCKLGPSVDPNMVQTLNDLGDAVNLLRQDNAVMQGQIDSMRTLIARQDTAMKRLQEGVVAALGNR